ncbi:MAG: sulfatase-like hydrolase/transferase [Erysipelotrichaceae bacterium]|nr:sulfatase-like hydrolase/transferase [Erysipelotrichaceae bacterium]
MLSAWLFITFFFIEVYFRILVQQPVFHYVLLRCFFSDAAFALSLAFLLDRFSLKVSRRLAFIVIVLFGVYAAVQAGYKEYMGYYLSLRLASYGAEHVQGYIWDFLTYLKPHYFITVLPAGFAFFLPHYPLVKFKLRVNKIALLCVTVILLDALFFGALKLKKTDQLVQADQVYQKLEYSGEGVHELGLLVYFFRDMHFLLNPKTGEDELLDIIDRPEIPVYQKPPARLFDDGEWKALAESETNENIAAIDQYLLSRPIDQPNDMTGILSGKNVIYIMVEAFDYSGIDSELTPTLYKMFTQGMWFDRFYSPQFSCATGESESIGINSLIPDNSTCIPHTYQNNLYSTSIFNLFKEEGYTVTSYHNWDDEFYPRNILHVNYGSEAYYDLEDLSIPLIQGWQSDYELMVDAYEIFSKEEPYLSFIITSSMHMPYDKDSTLGNRYLDEVQALYPNAPIEIQRYKSKVMELDKGMEYLLETLEAEGKLENTVIIMYGDHHPLKMSYDYLYDYTPYMNRREIPFGIDITPMVIYAPGQQAAVYSEPASTLDLVPTIANLFDLNYDPRLYMGSDYFSTQERLVIFDNGSWLCSFGYYSSSQGVFVSDQEYDQNAVVELNQHSRDLAAVSRLILMSDYFRFRQIKKIPIE